MSDLAATVLFSRAALEGVGAAIGCRAYGGCITDWFACMKRAPITEIELVPEAAPEAFMRLPQAIATRDARPFRIQD